MAVAAPFLQKRLAVRCVAIRTVELAGRAIFLGAVALDIAQMRARLTEAVGAEADRTDLHGGAPHVMASKRPPVRNERRAEPGAAAA